MEVALLLAGAYLLGSIPFGVLAARAKGVDLATVGSGNVGATNVHRALGIRWGLAVFALDVAKGLAPALCARLLFASPGVIDPPAVADAGFWTLVAGIAAVVGHCASPWLRFRGGKGIATGLGAILGSSPLVGLCALGVFALLFVPTRVVSLSSLVAAASLIPFGIVWGDSGAVVTTYGALLAFVLFRHRANIERLWKGTEPKFRASGPIKKESGTNERAVEPALEEAESEPETRSVHDPGGARVPAVSAGVDEDAIVSTREAQTETPP